MRVSGSRADHVILVGFDGLRPDSVTPRDCPHLHSLMGRAAIMPNHRSVFPSETRTNLTSLVTGSVASEHGIVGNCFFQRGLALETLIDTSIDSHLLQLGNARGGQPLQREHVGRLLSRAGRGMAILTTGSAGSLALLRGYPASAEQFAFNPLWPASTFPETERSALFPRYAAEHYDDLPRCAVDVFLDRVWPDRRPALSILWFAEADTAGHNCGVGAPSHKRAIRQIDEQLGRLIAWRDGLPERARIAICVASDHGQVTIGRSISLVDALAEGGLRVGRSWDNGIDVVVAPGLSPGLWVRNADPFRLRDAAAVLAAQPWCGLVFCHDAVSGTLRHADVLADHRDSPDLRVTFRGDDTPNAFGMCGQTSADIGTGVLGPGAGHHGGLHPAELACLFTVDGDGFAGGRHDRVWSRTTDIVPTLLAALGLSWPGDRMGRVIPEVLDGSTERSEEPVAETISTMAGGMTHTLNRVRVGPIVYIDGARTETATAPAPGISCPSAVP